MRSRLSLVELSSDGAGLELARIDAAEGERADERIVHDLEGEQRQRLVIDATCGRLLVRSSGSMPLIGGTSTGDGR
jgi:hypothetical protein